VAETGLCLLIVRFVGLPLVPVVITVAATNGIVALVAVMFPAFISL
jgi:hypothetical protein